MTDQPAMPQYSIASCFSTYLLPHVLFVDDFAERQKVAMICCLAWNIGVFHDPQEREQHIERVWKTTEADNPDVTPPAGMEEGFKDDLRYLVAQKRDLFPRILTGLTKADLTPGKRNDILKMVTTGGGNDDIPLVTHPDAQGLPFLIDVLKGIRRDTALQVGQIEKLSRISGGLDDIMRTRMERAYTVQRASLLGYQRILRRWRDIQPGLSVKRVIGDWLEKLEEIEQNTKSILALLTQDVA